MTLAAIPTEALLPPVHLQCCEAPPRHMAQSEVVVRAEGVSLHYGARAALKDVNLSMRRNSVTAIIGPSGCGKSSFLAALNRMTDMIPTCRVAGHISYAGQSILGSATDVRLLRTRIGMIFQRANPFPLSIRRNIDMPLRECGMHDRAEREERLENVLVDVGLWKEVRDRLDGPALGLSGGQQQRLCIARALALRPEVLLMDEPCSALDPISSGVVEDLILALRERVTIAIVTHNLAQAKRIGDDLAVFWVVDGVGRLIESGDAQDVFSNPTHPTTAQYVSGARG
jgi:phosphate transport system ATP-binding protein